MLMKQQLITLKILFCYYFFKEYFFFNNLLPTSIHVCMFYLILFCVLFLLQNINYISHSTVIGLS